MRLFSIPSFLVPDSGPAGRWKVWALASLTAFVAAVGTWGGGQYRIGQLDDLKGRYSAPVDDFASAISAVAPDSMESDLLQGCKQVQIGTWLQTTDALKFIDPASGNRVVVKLSPDDAYIDLNGHELSSCVSDEVENRQFDISSMTNTWAIILLLVSISFAVWSWICFGSSKVKRNVYAETLDEHHQGGGQEPPAAP